MSDFPASLGGGSTSEQGIPPHTTLGQSTKGMKAIVINPKNTSRVEQKPELAPIPKTATTLPLTPSLGGGSDD